MLLNDKLILWDEKPTYTNPDIIEMLMDQIIEVKFEDWFIQFWKIAVKYLFFSRTYWQPGALVPEHLQPQYWSSPNSTCILFQRLNFEG